MSDDAYQAALRGGLSAAMPKDATKTTTTTAAKQTKPPIVEESAGVKAAKALLEKMDNGSDDDKDMADSAAVNDALKKGLAAAAGLDKVSKQDKEKMKVEQEKSVADQAKSWLEGKTQEEKDALIQRAVSGGLANAAPKPKAPKKKKAEEEEEDDAEPLPSSVEAWLEKMKKDAEADDTDLSAAVKAALAGGASAAAIGSNSTGGKSKAPEKEKEYSIPPGVKTWIEANQSVTKWEEEAGETMTNAMYGGGIASMMAAKKKAESKPKKKVVAEEDIIPKSIQKWLDKNDVAVPTPEDDGEDEPLKETSMHIPPEVAKFLEEAKKEHSAEEVTAAFSELLK